jgi:F-type H+-transporting ATPase subunit delta
MPSSRSSHQLARHLCQLSLVDDQVSPERVTAVLGYLQQHPPRQPLAVLRQYRRLVTRQLARHHARVEHAGAIDAALLGALGAALSRKYRRPITAAAQPNPALIAGLRIRVGDDLYEASIAGQLDALAAWS